MLDSLTGGLATKVRDAAEASKLFNLSLKGTRTALIATGIGAFVVALGVVVAYWDEISDAIKGVTRNLEAQLKVTKSVQENLSAQLSTVEKQLELNKLQGVANEELEKQKVAILLRLQQQNEAETQILKNQLQRLEATSTEVGFWDTISGSIQFALFGAKGLASEATRLSAERLEQINKLKTDINNAEMAAVDLEIALFKINNPETSGEGMQREKVKGVLDDGDVDNFFTGTLERITQEAEKLVSVEQELSDKRLKIKGFTESEITKIDEKQAKLRAEITAIENRQKLEVTAQTMGAVSQLFGETTAAGKAAGSAQALINAYLGVTSVLSSPTTIPEPFGTISKIANAATILANGLKAVKQINSVKVPSGGGGSAVSGGIGGGLTAPATPSFNVVGDTGINQIGQVLGENSEKSTRAYVVWGDVKKAGDIEQESIQEASL